MLKENGNASIAVSRRFQQIQLASSIKIETKPRRPSRDKSKQQKPFRSIGRSSKANH
jgi:hypothetical protein